MLETEPIIIVYSSKSFRSTHSLTPNTWTFMYMNKNSLTTADVIRIHQEMVARKTLQKTQSSRNLHGLS